jgi:hypothetical protein
MKRITQTPNEHHWPRQEVKSIECRKRDLVVRIADWTRDRDDPGYHVEVYIGGVYDWNESKCCTIWEHKTKAAAKTAAILFAQTQISKLL